MGSLPLLSVDAVMAAMSRYDEAKREEQSARESYKGYSWGYHGAGFIEATAEAKQYAQETLDGYVRSVVRMELARSTAER